MPRLIRHELGATLLEELRQAGLGVRDVFEGRQEPLSWYFRGVAYDQSELDILESGAVETLHAPSALVELVIDEMALAFANVGLEGVASYLDFGGSGSGAGPAGSPPGDPPVGDPPRPGPAGGEGPGPERPRRPYVPDDLDFAPDVLLGYLNLDVAPPARWLEDREAGAEANERLASRLAGVARELGADADSVEVHIEGALDPAADAGWGEDASAIRPAGVSLYFSFDLPLSGASERELARIFGRGARTASDSLEGIREVFREG